MERPLRGAQTSQHLNTSSLMPPWFWIPCVYEAWVHTVKVTSDLSTVLDLRPSRHGFPKYFCQLSDSHGKRNLGWRHISLGGEVKGVPPSR